MIPCLIHALLHALYTNEKEIVRYDKLREVIDSWENKKKMKARRKLDKEEVSLSHSLYLTEIRLMTCDSCDSSNNL